MDLIFFLQEVFYTIPYLIYQIIPEFTNSFEFFFVTFFKLSGSNGSNKTVYSNEPIFI